MMDGEIAIPAKRDTAHGPVVAKAGWKSSRCAALFLALLGLLGFGGCLALLENFRFS